MRVKLANVKLYSLLGGEVMTERSMPLEEAFITYNFQEKRADQTMEGKAPGFVIRWKE